MVWEETAFKPLINMIVIHILEYPLELAGLVFVVSSLLALKPLASASSPVLKR